MRPYKPNRKTVQLFPATLLGQQQSWASTIPLLPANTCLLVTDTKTQKQTALMRQIAQSFRDEGWQVLIWLPANKAKTFEDENKTKLDRGSEMGSDPYSLST